MAANMRNFSEQQGSINPDFESSGPDGSAFSETNPLLHGDAETRGYFLTSIGPEHGHQSRERRVQRNLRMFPGVFSPVALSMFSTALFLRLGMVVGQSGIGLAIVQFLLAYLILFLTILSICAISTNGAVEGGGAYYMISRALGPEFGGSIGLLFFLANIFSCALYISGFVEGLTGNFGSGAEGNSSGIPDDNRWWLYLYCTLVLAFCLIVCLIGGAMFARMSVFILMIVVGCTITVVLSMFIEGAKCVDYPESNKYIIQPSDNYSSVNVTNVSCSDKGQALYTGFSLNTFKDNLGASYTMDYQAQRPMNFAMVFAILFSSVTGIMNGANMSGELRDPSRAIPKGTLSAACFTLAMYLVFVILTGATCSRDLLTGNYNYLKNINFWPPFVIIGIFATTLSAALGNLIGASRILEALARDEIFWSILRPATISTKAGNPIVAVLISWVLVQAVLLIGSLNAIAPLASELFMLSYASTNLACLGLDIASAPNFRPTFRYFSWHTALLGLIGCIVMCFLISPLYAPVAIISCLVLVIVLHLRDFPPIWGSISQALIFHQVRKYLLLLDNRKAHIKFWRPQMLLLVSNPRSCCELIEFVNDLKKGGLYVLGHVKIGDFDQEASDPCQTEYPKWQALVDQLKVKAFIELTLTRSIREGMHHLVRVSGMGGMKPNTICLGFYDNTQPHDSFEQKRLSLKPKKKLPFYGATSETEDWDQLSDSFPEIRGVESGKTLSAVEYIRMINDALKMSKNVCLCRYFGQLKKDEVMKSKRRMTVDVWPVNFFQPETANYFDNTCLFMLQLACILHRVPGWKTKTKLRVFLCVQTGEEDTERKERKLAQLLKQLRIPGRIQLVTWDHLTNLAPGFATGAGEDYHDQSIHPLRYDLPEDYLRGVNNLLREECSNTAITFCYLPNVPLDSADHMTYLNNLDLMTRNLPPTVLVHGKHPVTSTTL